MKKVVLALLAFIGLLIASNVPLHAAVPVYDVKNMPGSACRIGSCTPIPTSITQLQSMTMNVGGTVLVAPTMGANDLCNVSCPIVRDRFWDSVGARSAWIDVLVNPISPTDPSTRKISCNLHETTGAYTVHTSSGTTYQTVGDGQGPPRDSGTARATMVRLNLPIPYPPITAGMVFPTAAFNAGATYVDGYASIDCQIPVASSIYGYGWQESGGDPADW